MLKRTWTVGELREALGKYPDTMPVAVTAYEAGYVSEWYVRTLELRRVGSTKWPDGDLQGRWPYIERGIHDEEWLVLDRSSN